MSRDYCKSLLSRPGEGIAVSSNVLERERLYDPGLTMESADFCWGQQAKRGSGYRKSYIEAFSPQLQEMFNTSRANKRRKENTAMMLDNLYEELSGSFDLPSEEAIKTLSLLRTLHRMRRKSVSARPIRLRRVPLSVPLLQIQGMNLGLGMNFSLMRAHHDDVAFP